MHVPAGTCCTQHTGGLSRRPIRTYKCMYTVHPLMQEANPEAFSKLDMTRVGVLVGTGMGGLTIFQDGESCVLIHACMHAHMCIRTGIHKSWCAPAWAAHHLPGQWQLRARIHMHPHKHACMPVRMHHRAQNGVLGRPPQVHRAVCCCRCGQLAIDYSL